MLRLQVERGDGPAAVSLLADDGGVIAAWAQAATDAVPETERPQLLRSHDGDIATVVVDDVITVVRLTERRTVSSDRAGRAVAASFALDARWTLEVAGEVMVDGGFSGHYSGTRFHVYAGPEPHPDPATLEAEIARDRAKFAAAANVPVRRRWALRSDTHTVLVHESTVSRAGGGEALLWPPIAGPAGVLLRHAVVTDDGMNHTVESQPPWLVRPDGTVVQLPFELGVSPLLALPDGRWLLPGSHPLWLDGNDEPLSILDERGRVEPLLVAGQRVPASRVLREATPELLAALEPADPGTDVPWETYAARLDSESGELLLTIDVQRDPDSYARSVIVAALSLSDAAPARLIARFESTPERQIAVAP